MKFTEWVMYKTMHGVALCLAISFSCNGANNKQPDANFFGYHPLTLHWINTDLTKSGVVEIKLKDDTLILHGSQFGQGENKGDYISIQGVISHYSDRSFTLTGEIITRLRFDNGGLPCIMGGQFTFIKRDGKKYWRLQESKSACSTTVNYIDIYHIL